MLGKSLLFILLCGVIMVQCRGENTNLIQNGQFLKLNKSGQPEGWAGLLTTVDNSGGKLVYHYDWDGVDKRCGVDKTIRPSGKGNAYRIEGRTLLRQSVPVTPGKTYKFSYMLKTNNLDWNTFATFQVIWTDKGNNFLLTDTKGWDMKLVNTGGTVDWKYYEIDHFTAPPEARNAHIRFGKYEPDGICWFADLKMEECQSGDSFANRVATIPYQNSRLLPAAMKLDINTVFDETRWRNATVLNDYLVAGTGVKSIFTTKTSLLYDDEALWILFQCEQKGIGDRKIDPKLKSDLTDNIEVFLLPPGEHKQYHLLLNPAGVKECFIEDWKDSSWPMKLAPWKENGIESRIKLEKDHWLAGIRLPFNGMNQKTPNDGSTWRASFCRSVCSTGREESAWAYLSTPYFQRTDSFGKIIFRRSSIIASDLQIVPAGITGKVRNQTDSYRQLTAALVLHTNAGSFQIAPKIMNLRPGEILSFEAPVKTDNQQMLFMELRENDKLIAKHCDLLKDEFLDLTVHDPENVRTQTVNLAIDTPFFISWSMHHNLPSKEDKKILWRSQDPVDLYIEVPDGVNFTGMMHDPSAYRWKQSDLVKPEVIPLDIGGRKFNRFKFNLPLVINWDEPQFLFFYTCSLKEGLEFTGKTYFSHKGRMIFIGTKNFKTVRVGSVKRNFKRLPLNIGLMDAVTMSAWLPHDTIDYYRKLGFNCISIPIEKANSMKFYSGTTPKTREDYFDLIIQDIRAKNIPMFMNTLNISTGPLEHSWTRVDPDTQALGRDGKVAPYTVYGTPPLCYTYRGEKYRQWIDSLVNSSAFTKYKVTWLALDMEIWNNGILGNICYCPRCLKLFKEFCGQKGRADLAKLDPKQEMASKTNPEFVRLWKDFQTECCSGFVAEMIDKLRQTQKGFPSTSPQKNFICQDYGSPGSHYRLESMDWYEASFYFGPDNNYRKLVKLRNDYGMNNPIFAAVLTFGQTTGCPDFQVTPVQLKETLFETAIFGVRSIAYYYGIYAEPFRMKMIVEALNAITPMEDIILDGLLLDGVRSSNPKMLLTRRSLNNEMLLAVRSYGSSFPLKGRIIFDKIEIPCNVYDCDTREKVGSVTPANPSFEYGIAKNSCKLLYLGTTEQWAQRNR